MKPKDIWQKLDTSKDHIDLETQLQTEWENTINYRYKNIDDLIDHLQTQPAVNRKTIDDEPIPQHKVKKEWSNQWLDNYKKYQGLHNQK